LNRDTNAEPNGGEINRMVWTGLSMVVANNPSSAYGKTTLMAVRLKATALSAASERSIKVDCTRWLQAEGNGASIPTQNPGDVFYDILMNPEYGGQRPISEIDSARINALRAYWSPAAPNNAYQYNAIYTGKTTVWEALTQTLVPFGAAPLPLGGFMSVMQDGVKTARTMLFTEQNIVQDSFKLTYSFDDTGAPDGIEVEYRDPTTFSPAYVLQPSNAIDPERLVLFGCTNARHAGEFALLQWQRRTGNRRAVTFETEMEGLIPRLGDRVAVQHTLPFWGQSGFVVGVLDDRRHITLDRNLKWAEVTGPYVMLFRDNLGGVSNKVTATRDGADNKVLLSADPWSGLSTDWALTLGEELTHFAWGNETVVVKDFILTNIAPKGAGRVAIEGVYYDPTVFAGTMHFIQTEVPA
jgi:predicted phage tail protein